MKTQKYKSVCKCTHEKKAFAVNSKISLCFKCSSFVFQNESGQIITTIKPSKYSIEQETSTLLFLSIPDNIIPITFRNKSDFLKIRIFIVKQMKLFCINFKLSLKTYFLSLDYFDRICSKMISFDMNDLLRISFLCIILAVKFQESQIKVIEIKSFLGLKNNYSQDELFLLQLLDYDLIANTSYDILIDIMHTGFLFNNEKFSPKKMNLVYGKMLNMLYFFSETKSYIEMSHKKIALSFIGLIRETLGLTPYNDILKNIFMREFADIHNYYTCLKKLRKYFKIKDNNNHSDSNTDTNSDNNSDNNSENNDNKTIKNNLTKEN